MTSGTTEKSREDSRIQGSQDSSSRAAARLGSSDPRPLESCGPLIPDAVSAAAPCGRRGRGATPQISEQLTAKAGNLFGRRVLTVRVRPLKRHQPIVRDPVDGHSKAVWRVALNLLWVYFKCMGGFRIADDLLVRLWADALDDHPPEQVLWAIRAKADSLQADTDDERREKRRYVARPHSFIEPRILDYWIEQSPQGRRQTARQESRVLARKLDDAAQGKGEDRGSSGEGACQTQPQSPIPHPQFLPPALREVAADEQFNVRVWEVLSERRRRIVNAHRRKNEVDYRWLLDQAGDDEHLRKLVLSHQRATIAMGLWPDADYQRFRWEH